MTLVEVAAAVADHQAVELVGADVLIDDVHSDSRAVVPGSMYVAIRGSRVDGHDFVADAIASGAAAVAVEQVPTLSIPYLRVADTRAALGWLAAAAHRYPARSLNVVGITGTNGKTTVAHMLAAMGGPAGRQIAVVGTVGGREAARANTPPTTPEAGDLQRMLRGFVDEGEITDVAIEVSSHAMEMGRVNGIVFDVVAFTNLSQDHLDFHHTMEAYYQAKAALFSPERASAAVIWIDDPAGRRLQQQTTLQTTTVGTSSDATVRVAIRSSTPQGSTFDLIWNDRVHEASVPLAGRFNVSNAAIALVCADHVGIDVETAAARLATMEPVPGRYNTIYSARGVWVVIDYAHTPDAIANVIAESRAQVAGKVIAVVGAGGDRDREKRPLMGEAVTTADLAVITSDNPRSEDPDRIIKEVLAGIPTAASFVVESDRRIAIRRALTHAEAGDAVLILGKGHETGQQFADRVVPFDDATVAREELRSIEGKAL
ncbi:MAG: UDP-N-acetylmuramoyl-L-alanyl-D-glutamate--2,6-diaminopimelate ligase [Acidimicrobiia bacterium]|nr:UDP-N-acetylmuramoyl-L-alanyl-D-glutamate--2,6-diaminopimelate ligase [Acidimicrobiia bacterium]